MYNTTHVHIYEATPEVVYVGYTPGYLWSFPYYGVPVYGMLPNNIPNLYHGAPLRMYARYKRSGKATVTLPASLLRFLDTLGIADDLPWRPAREGQEPPF